MRLYIEGWGRLKVDKGTLRFIGRKGEEKVEKTFPVEDLEEVYLFGKIGFSGQVVELFMQHNIPALFFTTHGRFVGALLPNNGYGGGRVKVEQVRHYLDREKRMYLAKEFVKGAIQSAYRLLSKKKVELPKPSLDNVNSIPQLMQIEGLYKRQYYQLLFGDAWKGRKRRPPEDKINAALSFAYSLLYGKVVSSIHRSSLIPEVSFLHEPYERRFSLALDLAEPFKPYFSDRVVVKFLQRAKESWFDNVGGAVFLSKEGRRELILMWEEFLRKSVFYGKMHRHVALWEIIQFEVYKLEKHLLGMEKYRVFNPWW